MKICPYCKTENHNDAIICKSCQQNITTSAATADGLRGCAQLIDNCGCFFSYYWYNYNANNVKIVFIT